MNSIKIYGALFLTTVLWGVSFVGTKVALTGFYPFALIFYRFLIASVFFLLYFLRSGFPHLSKNQHLRLLLLSLFEPVLYFLFETFGLQRTTASEASLIIALIPVGVTIFSHVFLKEKISWIGKTGIFLSILGITILVIGGNGLPWAAGSNLGGNILILGAVVSAAFYTILSRNLGQEVPSAQITGFQFFYGTLFFLPLFLIFPKTIDPFPTPAFGALLFLALGATLTAFLCYNYALSKVKAAAASVFINGIPVVTAFTGWIVLGERLGGLQFLGAAIVILGVSLTTRGKKDAKKETPLAFPGK